MRKRLYYTIIGCVYVLSLWAVEVHIADPKSWTQTDLAPYVNQTVTFDAPMFLLYKNSVMLSPYCQSASNYVTLSGNYTKSTRDRTFSRDLKAKVKRSTSGNYYLEYVSGKFDGNTRETLRGGLDSLQINARGNATLLVCAANLEYYLALTSGADRGPASAKEHQTQRTKVIKALSRINADIYGLCEIEKGTVAVQEICDDLNKAHADRKYTFVNNGLSPRGTFTTCLFVYDANRVRPIEKLEKSQVEVDDRKYMMYFIDNETDEGFIFSINHFISKVSGDDSRRVNEANAVDDMYKSYKNYCHDEDLLIMGDLNAYADEKPITVLLDDGNRTDLHSYFHPEGSYSYLYGSAIGYLDHAIVNETMLPQVTGMQAFHVNSDESYTIEYPSGDTTMFRYSDHDPVVVGLHLLPVNVNELKIQTIGEDLRVLKGRGGYVRIFDMYGNLLYQHTLTNDNFKVSSTEEVPCMGHGCYVVHVYYNGENHVTRFIRP